jgi:hypothetical protein
MVLYITAFPCVLNTDVPTPVQLIPFKEYAIVFVPLPVAAHLVPLHPTPRPLVLKIDVPIPVQVSPSGEYAIVFVPAPTATK